VAVSFAGGARRPESAAGWSPRAASPHDRSGCSARSAQRASYLASPFRLASSTFLLRHGIRECLVRRPAREIGDAAFSWNVANTPRRNRRRHVVEHGQVTTEEAGLNGGRRAAEISVAEQPYAPRNAGAVRVGRWRRVREPSMDRRDAVVRDSHVDRLRITVPVVKDDAVVPKLPSRNTANSPLWRWLQFSSKFSNSTRIEDTPSTPSG